MTVMYHHCTSSLSRTDVITQGLCYKQEVKLGDRRRVEALFERAAAMDLQPKKMKVCWDSILLWILLMVSTCQ